MTLYECYKLAGKQFPFVVKDCWSPPIGEWEVSCSAPVDNPDSWNDGFEFYIRALSNQHCVGGTAFWVPSHNNFELLDWVRHDLH